MKILAIDTSSDACSASISDDGAIIERFEVAPRMHAELLLKMVDEVLNEGQFLLNQMDCLAFGQGPGAFTGLRIAAGVIQGLAFGADLPVAPVSSLAAVAQGVYRESGDKQILVAVDARMSEVYWGSFRLDERQSMVNIDDEIVNKPHQIPIPTETDWTAAGSGWQEYEQELKSRFAGLIKRFVPQCYPRAQDVAIIGARVFEDGNAVVAEQAMPVYLRNQVVNT